MDRVKLSYKSTDAWTWSRATPADVESMVALANTLYAVEITNFMTKNPTRYAYNLHRAILDQTFNPDQCLLSVAKNLNNELLAYGWLERGKYTPYANEEMAVAEILHIDLALPIRTRLRLIGQMFDQWIIWCEVNKIPVLCSTSIRSSQEAFMRLHEAYGFVCNGSFAYRSILF